MVAPAAGAATLTANSASSFVAALAAAEASPAADTIRITANFTIPADVTPEYNGASPLTIEGRDASYGEYTVSGSQNVDGGSMFLRIGQDAGEVLIRHLVLREFTYRGAILSLNQNLKVEFSNFVHNAAATEFSEGTLGSGSAISSNGGVTIRATDFHFNQGGAAPFTDQAGIDINDLGSAGVAESSFNSAWFYDNVGLISGGIMAAGKVDVLGSTFESNQGVVAGAAALAGDGSTIEWSEFSGNFTQEIDAVLSSGSMAGAVAIAQDGSITRSAFSGNRSPGGVGAVFAGPAFGGSVNGDDVLLLARNSFTGNSGDVGALYVAGSADVSLSAFVRNSAAEGPIVALGDGGDSASEWEIVNAAFAANSASGESGAVIAAQLLTSEQALSLTHATFANNPNVSRGNVASRQELGSLSLYGNAFGETNSVACDLDIENPESVSIQYNFDADGTCTNGWTGHGNLGEGLESVFLRSPGDYYEDDFELYSPGVDSPLVDAIPAADCVVSHSLDAFARPLGLGCDMGALEQYPFTTFEIPTAYGIIKGRAYGAAKVEAITWTEDLPGTPPADTSFPFGLSRFTLLGVAAGEQVKIKLQFPTPVNQLWKYTGGDWQKVKTSITSDWVTYHVTDGGALDEDGVANGVIVDPVAGAIGASFTG